MGVTVKVIVTAEHIANGKRERTFYNPIALAVSEQFGDQYAVVSKTKIHTVNGGVVDQPQDMRSWLERWDKNLDVSPETFYVPTT